MRHGQVVGHRPRTGEIEVDETRDRVADQQDIVGKQVGMDDRAWQVIGQGGDHLFDDGGHRFHRGIDLVPAAGALLREHAPCVRSHRIGPCCVVAARRKVHLRHGLADRFCLGRGGAVGGDAGQELDKGQRLALAIGIEAAERGARAVVHRARHRATGGGEMVEQAEKEGQVRDFGPPLEHREDVARGDPVLARVDQPVAVRHPFGDALGTDQFAHVEFGDQRGHRLGPDARVDGHVFPPKPGAQS